MKSFEIRNAFVDYFQRQGHRHVPSSSLIPENDPTLLFANAGMNQFKNLFLGLEQRDYKRAVTVQKCVRAGGKHNDLENVGFTARHHTFFEMLGNFSFGDYFKKDAIHFAWELLTKDLGIPKDKLYVTVFETDDEAADIWHKQEGVPRDRIFRLGEKDNFWRMGDVGPCGPCSEIFFDHGPLAGRESDPFKGIVAGEDRFVEIWNLVFMQYEETAPGKMSPLPRPSVDTGSGLERVVAALQGRFNNYNTDLFTGIIQTACDKLNWNIEEMIQGELQLRQDPKLAKVAGRPAGQLREDLAALRVLADHTRSTSFLIADGALPSNEGRGYVLRRIMRRAIRYGRKLSEKDSFLPAMSEALIQQMGSVYPELKTRSPQILSTIRDEESRFLQTLDQGTAILNDELKKARGKGLKNLSGEVAFRLYDTYGFPFDLTRLMANEQGVEVDETGFEGQMDQARAKSKASWKGKSMQSDEKHLISFAQGSREKNGTTVFTGYDSLSGEGKIVALSNGSSDVASLKAGESGLLILDRTPFYAEGGGQVGDKGHLSVGGAKARVLDCTKNNDVHLHHIEVESGEIKVGATATATVDRSDRRATVANHSATHLMHAALRQVLGTHVTQAGSVVDPQRLRFDFTHNKPMTPAETQQVENLVNEQIGHAVNVEAKIMKHQDAIQSGAMALFGEKYGDEVRVLRMGDFSTELCGGTHVGNTSQIRVFKIMSEGGVSAGVRRIEAITGDLAVQYLMNQTAESLKAQAAIGGKDISAWIEAKKDEVKALEKEIKKLRGGTVNVDDLAAQATSFVTKSGTAAKMVFADLDLDDREVLAQVTDQIKSRIQTGVVITIGKGDGSHPILVSVSKEISGDVKAGDLLKEIAGAMGGKGGGRPDFAQGAAPQREKINDVREMLKQRF
ncbi:MAG: alanine--tRNA ligase [Bdellovibrionaceae bacterium]|nr:alanine--tRNA ligase [Pseudobdellovibrionaceae bacterium]